MTDTTQPATLTVRRNANDDVQDRLVTLWVDEERWDVLRYGRTLSRELPPGRHRLRANNTLVNTTFEFDAAPGEHVRLRCSNAFAKGGALLMLLVGWAGLRVRIEPDPEPADDRPVDPPRLARPATSSDAS